MDHLFECPTCDRTQTEPLSRCVECHRLKCLSCIPFGFGTMCLDCADEQEAADLLR